MTTASMKNLAAAIVERAVDDWKKAGVQLAENPDYQYAIETREEVEAFLESGWFALLCEINPDFTKIHLKEMTA